MIAGCSSTYTIYGIPESQWEQKNVEEHQANIEHFKQQEEINKQTRTQAEKRAKKIKEQANAFDKENPAEELVQQCRQPRKHNSEPIQCQVITRRHWWFLK
jgi:DNA anti-recombination protein RmuC